MLINNLQVPLVEYGSEKEEIKDKENSPILTFGFPVKVIGKVLQIINLFQISYPLSSSNGESSFNFFSRFRYNLSMILEVPIVQFFFTSKKSTIKTPISSRYFSNVFSGLFISYLNLFVMTSFFFIPLANLYSYLTAS